MIGIESYRNGHGSFVIPIIISDHYATANNSRIALRGAIKIDFNPAIRGTVPPSFISQTSFGILDLPSFKLLVIIDFNLAIILQVLINFDQPQVFQKSSLNLVENNSPSRLLISKNSIIPFFP